MTPKLWMLPLQWLVAVFFWLVFDLVGTVLSVVMVPLAIWLGWDTTVFGRRIFWPWDAYPSPKTGTYYDAWYPVRIDPSQTWLSWWCWNHPPFFREFYWRVRNGFSNGARYGLPWKNAEWEIRDGEWVQPDVYRHDFAHGYYQYDESRWWLAKFRWEYPVAFEWLGREWDFNLVYYVGFKFERREGFGLTHRGQPVALLLLLLVWGLVS